MNDAKLDLGFRKHSFNGFGKTFESVNAGNENVFDSAILQFRDDLQPQLRAFRLTEPDA